MRLYPFLCGTAAAFTAGYYPLFPAQAKAPDSVKNHVRILNAGFAAGATYTIAEFTQNAFQEVFRVEIKSQHGQLLFFGATVAFVFAMKPLEKMFVKFIYGQPRRADFGGSE